MPNFKDETSHQGKFVSVIPDEQIVPLSFDHALCFLIDNELDFSELEARYKNDSGGAKAYSPQLLLKIVLAAYSRGITSSRDIEHLCLYNTLFMTLSGFNTPDHSTIAAFVSKMPGVIEPLFVEVIMKCDELGLIGKQHFAIDGCKLPSNASKEWSGTKQDFEKKYKKIHRAIRRMLKRHREEDKKGDVVLNLREQEIKQIEKLRKVSRKLNVKLKDMQDKMGSRGKPIKSNLTDNDSAHMKTGDKGAFQGYVGVAVADDKHQVILSALATGESEQSTLEPMIEQTKSNLEDDLKKTKLTADSGFYSSKNIEYCQETGVDAYLADNRFRQRDPRFANQQDKKPFDRKRRYFTAEEFHYDNQRDRCCCPAGREMWLTSDHFMLKGQYYRRFSGYLADCKTCALQSRCMRKKPTKQGRQVSIIKGRKENPPRPIDLMKEKIDSRQGRLTYAKRIGTIEPVFANIRNAMGLNYFSLRGKSKVNGQWLMYCIVHNIRKIQRYGNYLGQEAC